MPANRRTPGLASSSSSTSVPVGRILNPEIIRCLENELKRYSNKPKQQYSLRKAISSLEQYPKKLYSGEEAKTLKGIGPKTGECSFIFEYLVVMTTTI